MATEISDETKKRMIEKAKSIHGEITPCYGHNDLDTCFTNEMGVIMLWFNVEGGNTKVVQEFIK